VKSSLSVLSASPEFDLTIKQQPSDFPFPVSLITRQKKFILFAATEDERRMIIEIVNMTIAPTLNSTAKNPLNQTIVA